MTNYEWLVSTNTLSCFLSSIQSKKPAEFIAAYGMNLDDEGLTFGEIAKWLQSEHKEKVKYVKLDDVLDLIVSVDCFSFPLRDKLLKLSTKEIDE